MNNSIWMTIPYGKINGKYDNIKIMPTHQQNNNQPRHARRREIKHTAIENQDKICLDTKISVKAWDHAGTKFAHKRGMK